MKTLSKQLKFDVKEYILYNVLHVSAQKDNFRALCKYNNIKKINRLYYKSYPS